MKKQYVVISGIVLIVVLAIVAFVFSLESSKPTTTQNTSEVITPTPVHTMTTQNSIKTVTDPTIDLSSPTEVAKAFYTWYIAYPGNPVSSGAYKTLPYLTNSFKQTIGGFSSNASGTSDDPVFCTANKIKIVSASIPKYNTANTKANVMIQEKTDSARNLYRIVLIKNNNQWFIDDTVCEP